MTNNDSSVGHSSTDDDHCWSFLAPAGVKCKWILILESLLDFIIENNCKQAL